MASSPEPDALAALADLGAAMLLDDEDRRRLQKLDPETRALALRRLAVAYDRNRPSKERVFTDAAGATAYAGFETRSGVYNLIRRMKTPGLDALGLELKRRGGQPSKAALRETLKKAAAALLKAEPGMPTGAILRDLERSMDGLAGSLSRATLARIIDEVRATAPPQGPFGLIAFDAPPLDLVDADGERQRLFSMIEVHTGLVLGWRLAKGNEFERGYREAASDALATLSGPFGRGVRGIEVVGHDAAMEISLDPSISGTVDLRVLAAGNGWKVVTAPARIGRRVVGALGRRLAGIELGAGAPAAGRSVANGNRIELPIVASGTIATIDENLAAHNAHRLSLVHRAGEGRAAEEMVRRAVEVML